MINLTEVHIIKHNNLYYKEIDNLAFLSKNLYNYALYNIRQHFFETGKMLSYVDLYRKIRYENDYQQLPDKVSKGTIRKLYNNFTSFFRSNQDYKKNKHKYKAVPQLPRYLDTSKGRFLVIYEKDAVNIRTYKKEGTIKLSGTNIFIKTKIYPSKIKQVHITKCNLSYKILIIYEKELNENNLDINNHASIDLGVNNLVTLTSNIKGFIPTIYCGKIIKSINQGYNKRIAKYKSEIFKGTFTSNKIKKETDKRIRRIEDYLHKVSKCIVNQLVFNKINTLVIGYNKGWKQDINIGKVNNQKFVNIPFLKLIDMLKYKCELEGIKVILHEESYTSRCSFIDNEPLKYKDIYLGCRKYRGLFISNRGKYINADVNGSYNILKKVIPDFKYGIGAVVVSTVNRINVYKY